ncbi:MAG: hypothetical protein HDT19_04490 [Oscillibacter sp.]|nr:hypothetical protein [Oscillibacter sp.]
MIYFWTALRLHLAVRTKSLRFWLVLLLALAAGGAFRWISQADSPSPAPIQVGVALPEEGGEEFWAVLSQRSGEILEFIPTGEAHLRQMVASGRWDCGLILPEDFSRRLESGGAEAVTLATGPGSTVYPLVRETAAAALSALLWPQIAEEYLADHGLTAGPLPDIAPVAITLETLDGGPLTLPALARQGGARLFQGVTAALLLVWALFAAMDLGRWKETPAAARTRPCVGGARLLAPRLAAALIQALLVSGGALTLALGKEAGLAALAGYLLSLGGMALALSCRGAWRFLAALPPFAGIAALVLSPVAVDMGALFPPLAPLTRWLPTTWYLHGCGGDWTAIGKLLALAAALWGLALALSGQRPSKR